MEKFVGLYRGLHCNRMYCVLWIAVVWLHCAGVSQHFVSTANAAVHRAEDFERMNFEYSTARFQQDLVPEDSVDRQLLQVREDPGREVRDEPSEERAIEEEEKETWVAGDRFFTKNPYHLGSVPIKDWDQQRSVWLDEHPHKNATEDGKPRVLLVTGSQPLPCPNPGGDRFHTKALKNKIDYARMHSFELFHSVAFMDPKFTGVWSKLPILRSLMLSHPEAEWLFWMDMDAVFTDMLFEIPFHLYAEHNLVVWSWMKGYELKDWVAVNTGVVLVRNCQWSLDLLDKWSPMGPAGTVRNDAGRFFSSFFTNRPGGFPADDQSALMYVLMSDAEVLRKVKLVEWEYRLHGYWVDIVKGYEQLMARYHPGLGDCRWPFVTHFTGCSPCNGGDGLDYPVETCLRNFERAFNFADNQVLAYMGFRHRDLASVQLVRTWNETAFPLLYVGADPWADRLARVREEGRPDFC